MNQDLPKVYEPKKVEDKWRTFWEENQIFTAQAPSDKPPFTIVLPPPNVTGVLHMGHALTDTLQDVIVRFKRMQGYNTLWVPGTDHAGIATQTVVEKKLLAMLGKGRKEFSREEFLDYVWQEKEQNESVIINQLKKLGCSLDWSNYRFTMDEASNKAVRHAFKKLFEKGHIYRGDYLVNWDPLTQTALSDDEVEYEDVDSSLWYVRYPAGTDAVIVATTRPETMFGDVAIAVHPEDSRFHNLIGTKAKLPLTDREIPIVADEMVDPKFGSGAVKITPAHDPNDYELGKRHNLPCLNILEKNATLNDHCGAFAGMHVEKAREEVVKALKEKNLIEIIEPHQMRRGVSYRSKAPIQPFLSKQWFIKMTPFKESLLKAVKNKEVSLVPNHWIDTYEHWITHLRDWCISRQLWWGHQIPIWYHTKEPNRMICFDGDGLPPEVANSPEDWVQEEDVLDTWFSSALWPFSTLGWPEKTVKLSTFYPNQLLITGHDILFFWVARMILMGQFFMDNVPFTDCFIHGLIYGKSYFRFRDNHTHYVSSEEKKAFDMGKPLPPNIFSKWEKMSKSKGNVIDPLEIIDEYGTDALRFALVSSATYARQIDLDRRRFEEYKNFANKMFNGARFVLMHLSDLKEEHWQKEIAINSLEDQWIFTKLNQTITKVTANLEQYHFDKAAQVIYDFFWNQFCAVYVELSKPILFNTNHESYFIKKEILTLVLTTSMRLIHPFAPFISEEIFSLIQNRFKRMTLTTHQEIISDWYQAMQSSCLAACSFPTDIYPETQNAEEHFSFIMDGIYLARKIRGEMGLSPSDKIHLYFVSDEKNSALIRKYQYIFESLIPLQQIHYVAEEPETFGSFDLFGQIKIFIALPAKYQEKEQLRLEKEIEKIEKKQQKLNEQLSNQEFVQKAPASLVDKFQQNLSQLETQKELIQKNLKKLNIS
jgi:valyl-tRNA synthetase